MTSVNMGNYTEKNATGSKLYTKDCRQLKSKEVKRWFSPGKMTNCLYSDKTYFLTVNI